MWREKSVESIHGGLEQLIETVHTLDQLQSNACDEQLLQLLDGEAACSELHDQRGKQTTPGNDDVKDVPAVRAVA